MREVNDTTREALYAVQDFLNNDQAFSIYDVRRVSDDLTSLSQVELSEMVFENFYFEPEVYTQSVILNDNEFVYVWHPTKMDPNDYSFPDIREQTELFEEDGEIHMYSWSKIWEGKTDAQGRLRIPRKILEQITREGFQVYSKNDGVYSVYRIENNVCP